ncbi:hypothetical protein ABEF79_07085 [Acinetobacter sp. ANC 7454]|uniref:hypothetical protein n=1 Tax=Acinetobacter thermotolerans TaxID=3151487 RepID=UPI00325B5AC2
MIAIEKIKGLSAASDAETYTPSDLQAIAHIPDYGFLFDPDFYQNKKALDRVNGIEIDTTSSADDSNIKTVGVNKLFSTTLAEGNYFRYAPPTDINPKAHTVVFVAKPDPVSTSVNLSTIVASVDSSGTGLDVKVSFSGTRKSINYYPNGGLTSAAGALVSHVLTQEQVDSLCLYIISFSTEKGYEIRINGQTVATNTTDKTARTSQNKAGEYSLMQSYAGDMGIVALLNSDLTLPRNSRYLAELESFLMNKYNIV